MDPSGPSAAPVRPEAVRASPKVANRRAELLRLASLAAAAAWLLHPFATHRQIGAGDALWYANMLADFVLQWRAGVFPVFAGQTIHAFNGAVFPLRVCPFYQHLAGVLDLLTGRSLGFFALQHLVVIACGVAGLFGCYLALGSVAPNRRWPAAALAILYLSCPGVLAAAYTQDLYMTWTTLPFLPLAVFGIVRTFRRDTLGSQLWLAAPLAALWWAHSPIALWMTGVAAFAQMVRLPLVGTASRAVRTIRPLLLASFGVLVFALLAQYPFVSVACLHTPGTASAVSASLAHPEDIFGNIRSVFPAALLPLSDGAMKLSDLQLGYALWAVLLFCIGTLGWTAASGRRRGAPKERRAGNVELHLLTLGSVALLALLLPIPGLTAPIWRHMPEVLKRITLYWPMQRFYPILAALLAFSGQLALAKTGAARRTVRIALGWALALACVWSLWESRQFIRAGRDRTASASASEIALRPENLMLMNHSYGLFPALPAYFSNGVMDPQAETRLLASTSSGLSNLRVVFPPPNPIHAQGFRAPPSEGQFLGTVDANPGILDLRPTLPLQPGRRYELVMAFADRDYRGVLQLVGHSLFRQYLLPSSGEPLAFGSGPSNSHVLALRTTDPAGDDVALRFIPTAPGAKPRRYADFARFSLRELDPAGEQVEVDSLTPFRAAVRSPRQAWLETPRMYMPGYAAALDGHPVAVARSPQGLAMVPVGTGTHLVELRYAGPLLLRASYWAALASWAAIALAACGALLSNLAPRLGHPRDNR